MNKLLIVAIILLMAGVIYMGGQTLAPGSPDKTDSAQQPSPEPIAMPDESMSFKPVVMTGSGSMISAPFTVPADIWVVEWSYEPADRDATEFALYVYPSGKDLPYTQAVLSPEERSGSTRCYGSGQYYIEIGPPSLKGWEITIKPG